MKIYYKVCFVGLGSIASKHIMNLEELAKERKYRFSFFAIRSNKSSYEYKFNGLKITEIMIEDIDSFYFDLVFITNPTGLHLKTIQNLASSSKWFFIEKPVSDSVFVPSILPSSVIDYAYVSAPLRHTNLYKNIKVFINENHLNFVKVTCSSYMPEWQPNRDYRLSFRNFKHLGGGVDLDLIHEIDYLLDLFGNPNTVEKIAGHYSELIGDSNDLAVYILVYNDFLVEVHLDYFGRFNKRSIEFYTSNDNVEFDFLTNKAYYKSLNKVENFENNDHYYDELKYFFDLMSGHQKNINDILNALNTLKVAKV